MKKLILIGLPGSGKTTVGGLLARQLGLPFRDCDPQVERLAGRTVAQLFSCGEQFSDQRYAINGEGKLVSVSPASPSPVQTEHSDIDRVTRRVNGLLLGENDPSADNVSLDEIETMLLRRAIDSARGNVAAAARLLGITRPQMLYRLKSRGILQENS